MIGEICLDYNGAPAVLIGPSLCLTDRGDFRSYWSKKSITLVEQIALTDRAFPVFLRIHRPKGVYMARRMWTAATVAGEESAKGAPPLFRGRAYVGKTPTDALGFAARSLLEETARFAPGPHFMLIGVELYTFCGRRIQQSVQDAALASWEAAGFPYLPEGMLFKPDFESDARARRARKAR